MRSQSTSSKPSRLGALEGCGTVWATTRSLYRSSEWLAIGYFAYVSAVAFSYIHAPWRAVVLAALVAGWFWLAAKWNPIVRDFAPLAIAIAAYREMDWFSPALHDHHLENLWIAWDRAALNRFGLRAAIESTAPLLPNLLELCYALVYLVAPVAVWALMHSGKRDQINRFWMAYLAGTLGSYALFPYFPSDPPRILFPGADLPHAATLVRPINLTILGSYGIHSSVFPSAHVSSAFSAAWALLLLLPHRRWIGWAFAAYALCVAVATVYGRYHYAADVIAGVAMSLAAVAVMRLFS